MRFDCLRAWECAGTIGTGYSFAHAEYDANLPEQHLFRDQNAFCKFGKKLFFGSRRWEPHGGAIIYLDYILFRCYLYHFMFNLTFILYNYSCTYSHNINVEALLFSRPWMCRRWLLEPPFSTTRGTRNTIVVVVVVIFPILQCIYIYIYINI